MAATLLAAGIDDRSILFNQSAVHAHVRLAWIFNCVARLGWLNRMTQFKDKAGKNQEAVSAGLYVYPNLMAADIHAYHATLVPVGDDQRQHLELANDIAAKFNHDYGREFFPQVEGMILGPGRARDVPARRQPQDEQVRPFGPEPHQPDRRRRHDRAQDPPRQDRPAAAAGGRGRAGGPLRGAQPGRHLRRAVRRPARRRPARARQQGLRPVQGRPGRPVVDKLAPIAAETRRWLADPDAIDARLAEGAEKAAAIADPIVTEAERLVGFLKPRAAR